MQDHRWSSEHGGDARRLPDWWPSTGGAQSRSSGSRRLRSGSPAADPDSGDGQPGTCPARPERECPARKIRGDLSTPPVASVALCQAPSTSAEPRRCAQSQLTQVLTLASTKMANGAASTLPLSAARTCPCCQTKVGPEIHKVAWIGPLLHATMGPCREPRAR